MLKYGEALQQIEDVLKKQAFIPSPNSQAGQQMLSQTADQQQGQMEQGNQEAPGQSATGSGADLQAPPDDSSGGDGGGGQAASQAGQAAQDPTSQDAGKDPQGLDGRGDAPPTNLDSTTVTLRLRDVLDLVSGGKATQSALKIQDLVNKQQIKNDQMMKQQAQKEQQDQMQQQQQQAMAVQGGGQGGQGGQAGGGMMGSGGIYPGGMDGSQGGGQGGM